MWLSLNQSIYRCFDDVIVPARDGTTQIDHIIVSPYGIFVIETKNMKGWIFGSENSAKWTQSIYGKKTSFQNPIRQNYRHIKCLAEYLKINESVMHTVVFFIGECEFKTPMPAYVMNRGLSSFIKMFQRIQLSESEINRACGALAHLKLNPVSSHSEHVQSLNDRHSANGTGGNKSIFERFFSSSSSSNSQTKRRGFFKIDWSCLKFGWGSVGLGHHENTQINRR